MMTDDKVLYNSREDFERFQEITGFWPIVVVHLPVETLHGVDIVKVEEKKE